jgi:Chaperone of endosialidase
VKTGPTPAPAGPAALGHNTTGKNNTAVGGTAGTGAAALGKNTKGSGNTAVGSGSFPFRDAALGSNTKGDENTAIGQDALNENTTGNKNTAVGAAAGTGVETASNVICIGADVAGADVSNTTWLAGVYNTTTQSGTTAPVIVSDTGQLGTVASSERFKKDIATMQKVSEAILSLRPVTFHYKTDTKGTPQFGLIAEEVAKVNPALVLPDKEGKPFTVRYDAVNAMLLNEFLKEHRTVQELKKEIAALTATVQKVSAQVEMNRPAAQVVENNQ